MFAKQSVETLETLLVDGCRNLNAACRDLSVALQRFAKFARTPAVREGIDHVLRTTEGNIERLERVGNVIDRPMGGGTCHAMRGIIQDIDMWLGVAMPPHVADVTLVNGINHILGYSIAAYGIARQSALRLGDRVIANCLTESMIIAEETERAFAAITADLIDAAAGENAKSD